MVGRDLGVCRSVPLEEVLGYTRSVIAVKHVLNFGKCGQWGYKQ